MSLVDQFDTRDFVNGRLVGGNYNEMTGNMTYSDISPYGANRMAGSGLGLGNDVVAYMGNAGMGGPRDEGMDDFIGRAVTGVISDLLLRPEDKAESRTMEYRPERDGFEVEQLGAVSDDLAQSFDVTPGGDTRRSRKGLTPGDVRRLMEAYPNDAEKIQKMYLPGAQLPKRV
jgi:hypothetical protein